MVYLHHTPWIVLVYLPSILASETCPCLTLDQTPLKDSNRHDKVNNCMRYETEISSFCFPMDYGFDKCKAHDQDLEPYCVQPGFPGPPEWCGQAWCYVDPNNCDVSHFKSSFFSDIDLHFSYRACGEENTFSSWLGDGNSHSFSDLATLVERYVIGVKLSLEERTSAIRDFSLNKKSVLQECDAINGCDCDECHSAPCWGRKVNFHSSSLVLNEKRQQLIPESDVDFAKCASNEVAAHFLRISGRESNDENRVAFQYFGDQRTGALVQVPAAEFCIESYDARFRPWYAIAVSGAKDIIIVVDTSGSMNGLRLQMAKAAIQEVVKTLTWVDYVTVISFDSLVGQVYSQQLVAATEEVVQDIALWAEKLKAKGGTNFHDPIAKAYTLLEASVDSNDRKTCAQSILFMTDGEASFDRDAFKEYTAKQPNVVVFTYALGSDAAVEPLQAMSCETGGIFYPVKSASSLPKIMSEYYRYYIQLRQTCSMSWIKYTGANTGVTFIAGCSAIYDYGNVEESPGLVGVTCQDLNTIVSLDHLKSCTSNGLEQFIEQVRREAASCPPPTVAGKSGKITDECTLQRLRASVDIQSVCPTNVTSSCKLPLQPTNSSCDGLKQDRFKSIELTGCKNRLEERCPAQIQATTNDQNNSVIILVVVLVVCFLLCTCCCFVRRASSNKKKGKKKTVVKKGMSCPSAKTLRMSRV